MANLKTFEAWYRETHGHTETDIHNLSASIQPFLRDIVNPPTSVSDEAASYMQNGSMDNNCHPQDTIDYWILDKYIPNTATTLSDFPILLLSCFTKDGISQCTTEQHRESNIYFQGYIDKTNNQEGVWPFYIDIELDDSSHRICCYYFGDDNELFILDSNFYKDAFYDKIVEQLKNIFPPETHISSSDIYYPQYSQKIKLHKATHISPYFIKDRGTCAMWARIMFIIGKLGTKYMTPDTAHELFKYLNAHVFNITNIILTFQVFVASIIHANYDAILPYHTVLRRSNRLKTSTTHAFVDNTL